MSAVKHSNTVACVRAGADGSVVATHKVPTPSILSYPQYLPFWLSWQEGHIKLGRGTVINDYVIVTLDSPLVIPVTSLSIMTTNSYPGIFVFDHNAGKQLLLFLSSKVIVVQRIIELMCAFDLS